MSYGIEPVQHLLDPCGIGKQFKFPASLIDLDAKLFRQAEMTDGTLKPVDYTNQNSSYATAAGGAISTADDLATWIKALVSGKVFNADFHQQWLESRQIEDPDAPGGQGCDSRGGASISIAVSVLRRRRS